MLSFGEVYDLLAESFGGVVGTPMRRGGYSYHRAHAWPAGARVYSTPGRAECFVVLPGEACEALGQSAAAELVAALDLSLTRLDVAWDTELITPRWALQQFRAGQVVTRAHRDSWREWNSAEGHTVYLGSRQSGRMVRVYDRRGLTRVEMEMKDERARALWRWLLQHTTEDWPGAAMAHLRDFLDFRRRDPSDKSRRPASLPLLRPWARFVAGARRKALPIPRRAPSIERAQEWLRRSVAPVLAVVAQAAGDPAAYLSGLTRRGRERWGARHWTLLRTGLASGPSPTLAVAPPV